MSTMYLADSRYLYDRQQQYNTTSNKRHDTTVAATTAAVSAENWNVRHRCGSPTDDQSLQLTCRHSRSRGRECEKKKWMLRRQTGLKRKKNWQNVAIWFSVQLDIVVDILRYWKRGFKKKKISSHLPRRYNYYCFKTGNILVFWLYRSFFCVNHHWDSWMNVSYGRMMTVLMSKWCGHCVSDGRPVSPTVHQHWMHV